ncbi:hypothetical protein PAMP_024425 [Pampus punctatissimus]
MSLGLSPLVMGAYNWARHQISSIFSGTEKEALIKQVEELKAQLQKAHDCISSQEQKATQLAKKLQLEVSENESLWNQVAYLTNKLHREKNWRQQQSKKESTKYFEEQTLRRQYCQQLEETKIQSDILQQQHDTEKNSLTEKVSVYQEQIQRLWAEKETHHQRLEQEIKLLQQKASERETSICRELVDLKIRLHEQMLTNLEEAVSRVIQTETAQLTEELNEEEESIPSLETPELLEEAKDYLEKIPEKKIRSGKETAIPSGGKRRRRSISN